MEKICECVIKKADDIPQVAQEPVMIRNVESDYIAIVEEGSNRPVGVHTNKYQLVQNRDVYDTIASLKEYKINKAGLYKNGQRMYIELQSINAPPVKVLPKDDVIPMARILNSYDGSLSVAVCSFGIRKVCTNGMIAPVGTNWISSSIHKGNNIDLDRLHKNIEHVFTLWDKSKDVIVHANKYKTDSELALFYTGFSNRFRTKALENLKPEDTVYNVWNEITRRVTHDLPRVNSGGKIKRQKKANKIFDLIDMDDKKLKTIAKELKEFNEKQVKK